MKNKFLPFVLFILFIAAAVSYNFIPFEGIGKWFNNILYYFAPAVALIYCFRLVKIYGAKNIHGGAFLYFAIGLAAWFVGDIVYVALDSLGYQVFPSFIDVIYLIGYPLILICLIKEMRFIRDKNKTRFTAPLVALFISIALLASYFFIFLTYDIENNFFENLFNVLYGLGDVIITFVLALLLKVTFEYKQGKVFSSYLYIIIGVVLTLLADILYGQFFEQFDAGITIYKNIDLLYFTGYLFFAYGFYSLGMIIKSFYDKAKSVLL